MFFKIYYINIIFYFVSQTNAVVETGKTETLGQSKSLFDYHKAKTIFFFDSSFISSLSVPRF